MTKLPAPPIAPDVSLRDFPYMPLCISQLLDSETWLLATGDEAKAAVTLWCKAWHQVPAGSLPDNDRMLAKLSGADANWADIKAVALRGFTLCSDGRLYHGVLVEKAIEAWESKIKQRARTAAASKARSAKSGDDQRNGDRNDQRNEIRDDDRNADRNGNRDAGRDDQRNGDRNEVQGKGIEEKGSKKDSTSSDSMPRDRGAAGRVTDAFLEAIRCLWPQDSRIRPSMAADSIAADWMKRGLTETECIDLIRDKLAAHADKGNTPPSGLNFLGNSATDAIGRKKLNGHGSNGNADFDYVARMDQRERDAALGHAHAWRKHHMWLDDWGPGPDQPQCRLPPDVLAWATDAGPAPADVTAALL